MGAATLASAPLGLKLSVLFGALFLIHGVHLTYLPVWLDGRGLSSTAIAVASSTPMLIRILITPVVAFAADRRHIHREVIVAACSIAVVLMLALTSAGNATFMIVLVVAMLVSLQTIMPMADTLTMAAVKERGLDYGRIRLWGSATFILASYLAGAAVAQYGSEAVLHLSIVAAALTTAAAIWLPGAKVVGASSGIARLTLADALRLARNRSFVVFVIAVGAIQASHAVMYVFGVLHWRSLGLSAGYIATLWGIAVIGEIALFWAARWIAPLGPVQLLMIGGAAGIVRWLAMAFDPAPYLLVPLQVLHAGTFAATHLGAMHWIGARVPAQTAGTAQALLSTFTAGIAMSAAMMISGLLYTALAGGAYLAMMASCVLGLAAAGLLSLIEARPSPRQ